MHACIAYLKQNAGRPTGIMSKYIARPHCQQEGD